MRNTLSIDYLEGGKEETRRYPQSYLVDGSGDYNDRALPEALELKYTETRGHHIPLPHPGVLGVALLPPTR